MEAPEALKCVVCEDDGYVQELVIVQAWGVTNILRLELEFEQANIFR